MSQFGTVERSEASILATNKVLKNTYMLLAMTLFFSAVMAGLSTSMASSLPSWTGLASSIAAIAIIWLVLPRVENSAAGVPVVFLFTGLLGFGLGPMLSSYLSLPNGSQLIMTAMGGTATIFVALSAYVLTSRKDFSFMGGMLMVGFLVIIIAAIANIFLQMPILSIAISSAVILIMSGFILYDTSNIIHGGETNYVRATVSLYLNIYNIFVSLLSLLGALSNDD